TYERCDGFPSLLDRCLRLPAEAVRPTRRVTEMGREIGQHGLDDPVVDAGCCVVVQIDGSLDGHVQSLKGLLGRDRGLEGPRENVRELLLRGQRRSVEGVDAARRW